MSLDSSELLNAVGRSCTDAKRRGAAEIVIREAGSAESESTKAP
jgi:hypothetical protein